MSGKGEWETRVRCSMEEEHCLQRGRRGLVDSRAMPVDPRNLRYDFSVSFPLLFIGGTVPASPSGPREANEAIQEMSPEMRLALASLDGYTCLIYRHTITNTWRQASQPASHFSPWRDRSPSPRGRMIVWFNIQPHFPTSVHPSIHSSIHCRAGVVFSCVSHGEDCHLDRSKYRRIRPARGPASYAFAACMSCGCICGAWV